MTLHGSTLTVAVYELGKKHELVGQYAWRTNGVGEHVAYHTELAYAEGVFEYISPGDYEKIASLKPDLILGGNAHLPDYDKLSLAGPTVIVNWELPVLQYLEKISESVGAQDQFERLRADFLARVDTIRAQLSGQPQIDVAFATAGHFEEIWVSRVHGAMSDAMSLVGIRTAPAVEAFHEELYGEGTTKLRTAMSTERIDILDADLLLLPYWYFLVEPGSSLAQFDHQTGVDFILSSLEEHLPGYCSFLRVCREGQLIVFESTPHYSWSFGGLNASLDFIEDQILPRGIVQIVN